MAKKRTGGVNKAQMIRDYFAVYPDASGVDVVKALADKGVTVAAAQVSNVKTAAKKNGRKPRRPGRKQQAGASSHGIVAAIEAAKALIDAAGSADDAKLIIDILNGNMVGNG